MKNVMPGFDGKKRTFTYQKYWEYFTKVRVNQTVNQTVKFLFFKHCAGIEENYRRHNENVQVINIVHSCKTHQLMNNLENSAFGPSLSMERERGLGTVMQVSWQANSRYPNST